MRPANEIDTPTLQDIKDRDEVIGAMQQKIKSFEKMLHPVVQNMTKPTLPDFASQALQRAGLAGIMPVGPMVGMGHMTRPFEPVIQLNEPGLVQDTRVSEVERTVKALSDRVAESERKLVELEHKLRFHR